jgi:hypothetical protein
LLARQATAGSRISCSFKGLNVEGDTRPPEQRTLALQIAASAAAAVAAAPSGDGGAAPDAAAEQAALQQERDKILQGPPIRRWPKAESPPKSDPKRAAGKRDSKRRKP